MRLEPTPEQVAIIRAAVETEDNLIISALAGAAKTSTLVMIAEALPKTSILCLAFNKRIATEMEKRLPPNCHSFTLNSMGHRAWMKATGRRLIVNTKKNYELLKGLVDGLSRHEKEEAYSRFSDILKAVEQGKTAGWIPAGTYPNAKRLLTDEEFFALLEEEPSKLEEYLIKEVSKQSIAAAFRGTIDFNDQILLPALFPVSFPQYPLVLVDEKQDLSELNHRMLVKLARKRLIGVGDECQSIYAFRGAHQNSMALLREQFNMRPLSLTISFRCPRQVVSEARWRAPAMQWPDWAIEGEVRHLDKWGADDVPADAAIICRNNAPLFSMAIRLLRAKRYPVLIGNDIGKNLIKHMKKFGDAKLPQAGAFEALEAWFQTRLKKSRNEDRLADMRDCIAVFLEQGSTLGDAIAYAEHIMNVSGSIQLMTGHKSKGLEFDEVFILDRHLIRVQLEQQEKNLLYVMQTRAKKRLTYVSSETFGVSE